MTLQQFEEGLKAAAPGLVYELAGPKGIHRYVCWHRYGAGSVVGDNRNQIDAPRVQAILRRQVDQLVRMVEEIGLPLGVPVSIVA